MKRGPIHIFDRSGDGPDPEPRRASWYTPGTSDGLGDRLLMFDNSTASSLELLRFKPEFSDQPAFEAALRRRFDELAGFRHPQVAVVRAVKWLGDGEGLALVSEHVDGRRLSELVHDARGPVLAMELVRQLAPVLAELEAHAGPAGHGALTADRIVVGPDGQLVIVEHVIGPAIAQIALAAERLRAELHLAVRDSDAGVEVDGRADVVQLALAALSLALARPIDPAEFPDGIASLLEEAGTASPGRQPIRPPLRDWLERALLPVEGAFRTASDASAAWTELVNADAQQPLRSRRLAFPRPAVARLQSPGPSAAPSETAAPDQAIAARLKPAQIPPIPSRPPRLALPPRRRVLSAKTLRVLRWVVAGALVVAAAEAVVIFRLTRAGRATTPGAASSAIPATSEAARIERPPAAQPAPSTPPATAPHQAEPIAPRTAPPAATAETRPPVSLVGGLAIVTPFEMQAFENGQLVGSTAGAIALASGSHVLDLVSDLVGYRTRETVSIRGGQTTRLTIAPPNGRISVNATPWAEVWIDGVSAGETPLANLPVALGTHQVTFRHPQLGEQRQTAIVKMGAVTRVTAKFQR